MGRRETKVPMGHSRETDVVQNQEGARSLNGKGHRKAGTADLKQMVPVENTGLPPLLSPSPTPNLQYTPEPTGHPKSWKTSGRCVSAYQLPGHPSFLASQPAPLTSAQSASLTLYQQPCVGAVLTRLAAVGALVLRSHVMDDQAVGGAVAAQLILVSGAQLDPLPQPAHVAPRAGHSHLQYGPAADQNRLLSRGAAAHLERQCWG